MIISALSLTTAFYVYTYNRAYAAGFHDGAAKQLQRDNIKATIQLTGSKNYILGKPTVNPANDQLCASNCEWQDCKNNSNMEGVLPTKAALRLTRYDRT